MFSNIVAPIVSLLNSLVGPLLMIVGALGTIYCIILGVKYAKAEEPQEREKAKSSLVNSVIGFVLIFVLILALNLLMPTMVDWVSRPQDRLPMFFPAEVALTLSHLQRQLSKVSGDGQTICSDEGNNEKAPAVLSGLFCQVYLVL